jgi:hypothetical protein
MMLARHHRLATPHRHLPSSASIALCQAPKRVPLLALFLPGQTRAKIMAGVAFTRIPDESTAARRHCPSRLPFPGRPIQIRWSRLDLEWGQITRYRSTLGYFAL